MIRNERTKMSKEQLTALLDKFYDGSTSPEEELVLYLKLLDEPEGSPYQTDLKVLEGLMNGAALVSHETAPSTRRVLHFFPKVRRWAVAAAVPLLIGVGTYNFLHRRGGETSFLNQRALHQEEVDRHAAMAFSLLDDCLEAGSTNCTKAQDVLNEASGYIEASYQQLDPVMDYNTFEWQTLGFYE